MRCRGEPGRAPTLRTLVLVLRPEAMRAACSAVVEVAAVIRRAAQSGAATRIAICIEREERQRRLQNQRHLPIHMSAVMSAVGLRCTLPARPHIRSHRAQRYVGPSARTLPAACAKVHDRT
jgi:hypothetical protein